MVRTRLKLAATLTVVVLALTGFQTSSSGGHGSSGGGGSSGKSGSGKSSSRSGTSKSSGGGGGGCSSSKKKNNDYDDYDDEGSGSSGGSSSTPSPTATATPDVEAFVVECVEPARKKSKGKPARKADTTATLKIVSRAAAAGTYTVALEFKAADGSTVDRAEAVVSVDRNASKAFDVPMRNPKAVDRVRECSVYEVREVPQPTATPTAPASTTPTPTPTPSG
ncbi:hypothetical protein ACIGO8_31130 [Streptomyces sp. NPDC053493]|uniref:hypothetical protein n=1 Tax=Streptomyces sp. NPDC053493 TaxID=3365705 RepID=UPI0037D4E988